LTCSRSIWSFSQFLCNVMMHPAITSNPMAAAVSQLPRSPIQAAEVEERLVHHMRGDALIPRSAQAVHIVVGSHRPPSTVQRIRGTSPPVVVTDGQERAIRPNHGGRYNLDFFDSNNEYEHMGSHASIPQGINVHAASLAPGFPSAISTMRHIPAGASDIHPLTFPAHATYEQLLALDGTLQSHRRGLSASERVSLLVTAQRSIIEMITGRWDAEPPNLQPDRDCSVCMVSLTQPGNLPVSDHQLSVMSPSAIVWLKCFHCFHYRCIDTWLQQATTCPECREEVRIAPLQQQ